MQLFFFWETPLPRLAPKSLVRFSTKARYAVFLLSNPLSSVRLTLDATRQIWNINLCRHGNAGQLHGVPRNPDLILTLECSLLSVLDLTDSDLLEQLGTSHAELVAESPSRFIENARGRMIPTQQLGSACFQSGHISAIKVPSAANPTGFCIDIFPECMFEGEFIRVRDDAALLRAELVGQIPRLSSS